LSSVLDFCGMLLYIYLKKLCDKRLSSEFELPVWTDVKVDYFSTF
jgi:hypothetical protein